MTNRSQRPADRPAPARRCAGSACRRPGRGRRPGVRPLRQHPARLSNPVAALRRLVRRDEPTCPAGRASHRGPLPGCPRRLRRQHRHPAPGHLRHYQGTRVGGSRIALQGSWGTRLFERMGTSVGEAPAPGRRPHRRRARRDPAHRSETPCPRPRRGDVRAGG